MKIKVKQLEFIDATLRIILIWLEGQTGIEFTITSIYRIGDKGVHGVLPVRGIDLRMRDNAVGLQIESLINDAWQYDPNRPEKKCAVLHGQGLLLHLHTQVHPNTKKVTQA